MNTLIIQEFSKLIKQIEAEYLNAHVESDTKKMTQHKHRLDAVKKIFNILKKIDFEITNPDELAGIPGIGSGTIKRIREILETGKLSEITNKYDTKIQSKIDSIQQLEKVIGIGSSNAKKLVVNHKITSVEELREAILQGKIKVSNMIKLGLKYYGIVHGNIPRQEIMQIEKYLLQIAHGIDMKLHIMICGSYRRGKDASGDVDVLVYHDEVKKMDQIMYPKKYRIKSYFNLLVDELTHQKFLLDSMTDKDYNVKYMGFCKYKNNPVRRIDMRYVSIQSLPAAMLYLTGPYELNQIMRSAAKRRDILLNEYGLYKKNDDGTREIMEVNSEAQIFEILGMDYLTPQQREAYSSARIKKTKI